MTHVLRVVWVELLSAMLVMAPVVVYGIPEANDAEYETCMPTLGRKCVNSKVAECLVQLRSITDPGLREIMIWVIGELEWA